MQSQTFDSSDNQEFQENIAQAKRWLSTDPDSSLYYVSIARFAANQSGELDLLIQASSLEATIYRSRGEIDLALNAINSASTIVQEFGNEFQKDFIRLEQALNQLGFAQELESVYDFDGSEEIASSQEVVFSDLMGKYHDSSKHDFLGKLYQGNAARCRLTGQPDSILKYANLAGIEFRQIPDSSELANTYILSAAAFLLLEEPLKIILMAESAREIAVKLNETSQIALTHQLSALAYNLLDEGDLGMEMLQRSDSLLADFSDVTSQSIVLRKLLSQAKENGDIDMALGYSERLNELDHAQQIYAASVAFEEIKTKYDVAETNRQLLESEKETQMAVGVLLILLVLLLAGVVIFLVYRNKQRTKTLAQERQMSELMRQQELVAVNAMLEGQETERKRIGQDLHDNIGSLLATARMQVSAAKDRQDAQINNVSEILDEAASEVRKISHNLVSGTLSKFGLIPAIKELAERIDTTTDLEVSFTSIGMDGRLSAMQEVNLYRIAQELISNAIKHSFASKLKIKVQKQSKEILLQVKDDGIGLSNETNANLSGVGLKNIQGRVNALSGSFNMVSEPGKGTQSNIRIPITENIPVHAEN